MNKAFLALPEWSDGEEVAHSVHLCSFGGGGGGGTTQTIQKSDPWSGQQGYLTDVFGQAQNLYNNYTPQYFPNSTVAGLTPYQNAGINMEAAYGAGGGNSAVNASTNALTNFSNGNYLSAGNPYFQNMANNVLSSVVPGLESQFAQGNRMNSPGAAYAVSKGATDALGGLAYQNYNDQLGNMLKSSALSPSLQGADYQNIQAVQDAGNQVQAQNQNQLNDQVNRYKYYQELPYNQLANYNGMIQGSYGGTSTMSQPYYQNQGANAISGGLGGMMLGSGLASAFPATMASLGLTSGAASGIGAGAGALFALLSDKRLKKDISRIGTSDNGLPIYAFRYKGEDELRVGLMAQDVETVRPEAVITLPSGYKAVDYAAALA